ncbi:VanZ family protein [bacterium]|nr:MAG: VanZ family protein [bacterium]
MLNFLNSFSDSFILALFLWPFLAFILTLPILVHQYRRHNRIVWLRILLTYFFILYVLGLVSFTLYPMPDNPIAFCQNNVHSPLLNPLHLFTDLRNEGLQAVLQIVMNFIFFIPLGFFIRHLFQLRLRAALIIGFSASLLIETAQLTGLFSIYPCSYRYFDINDLFINTGGALIGYIVARLLPSQSVMKAKSGAVVRQAGLLRHFVAFLIDQALTVSVTLLIILGIYLMLDKDLTEQIITSNVVVTIVTLLIFGLLPYLFHGWSVGGFFTRLNHDDQPRTGVRRITFYLVRAVIVGSFTYATWGILPYLIVIIILCVWWRWKKLPHQFI